jgi:hypothetical protein
LLKGTGKQDLSVPNNNDAGWWNGAFATTAKEMNERDQPHARVWAFELR